MRLGLVRMGWSLLGLSALGLAMTALGAGRWYMELAAYAVPLYAVFGSLVLLIGVWCRDRRLAQWASLVALFTFFLLWWAGRPQPIAPTFAESTERVRILTANLFVHNDDPDRLLDFIRATHPDVLMFQEFDSTWQARLKPLEDIYPAYFACPRGLRGELDIGLYWRLPDGRARSLVQDGLPGCLLEVDVMGQRLALLNLHTAAPFSPSRAKRHSEQMRALAKWIVAEPRAVVVAGDLNSTPWTPLFRETLAATGLQSARTGIGVLGTWPAYLGPIATPLDHVLFRTGVLRASGCWLGPYFGSDHLPLLVDLEVMLPVKSEIVARGSAAI